MGKNKLAKILVLVGIVILLAASALAEDYTKKFNLKDTKNVGPGSSKTGKVYLMRTKGSSDPFKAITSSSQTNDIDTILKDAAKKKEFTDQVEYVEITRDRYDQIKKELSRNRDAKITHASSSSVSIEYKTKAENVKVNVDSATGSVIKLITILDGNNKGDTLEIKIGANGDVEARFDGKNLLPSDKWNVKNGKLFFGGREVDTDKTKTNDKVFLRDGGEIIEVKPKQGNSGDPLLIEKDANGAVYITEKGKDRVKVEIKGAEKLLGSTSSDPNYEFISNFDSMLEIAKLNRVKTKDLSIDDASGFKLVWGEKGENSVVVDGDELVLKEKNGETRYKIQADGSLSIQETTLKDDKGNDIGSINVEGDRVEIGDTKTLDGDYELDDDAAKQNLQMHCDGSKCINLLDGKFYTKSGSGKDAKFEEDKSRSEEEKKELEKLLERRRIKLGGPNNREQRALRVFGALEGAQSGFGKLSSLIIGEDDLAEWRASVDEFFCSTVLFGGADCWSSLICEEKVDKIPESVLAIDQPGGAIVAIANTVGERQEILYEDNESQQREFLYKLSFGVRNPEDAGDLQFNVFVDDKALYNEDWIIKGGETFSRSGARVFVTRSTNFYENICIVFRGGVENYDGDRVSEVCNDIVEASPRPPSSFRSSNPSIRDSANNARPVSEDQRENDI